MESGEYRSLKWLRNFAPEFRMNGEKISVLFQPQEFYDTLTDRIKKANHRVALASLYLGTGDLEQQLMNVLQEKMRSSSRKLQVRILLDYTRGSRGLPNSRTVLLPLLNGACSSSNDVFHDVNISLYHTPDLRGLLKYLMPNRWNEIVGLAHMKVYVADDAVILSGANLSNDYFTNRQDRYIMFEDKNLADFFESLIATVSTFSLQLQKDNTVRLNENWDIHPFKGDYYMFASEANHMLQKFLSFWKSKTQSTEFKEFKISITNELETDHNLDSSGSSDGMLRQRTVNENALNGDKKNSKNGCSSGQLDTLVYPLIQMRPLGIEDDSKATAFLFQHLPPLSTVCLATGYFNLTSHYADIVINSSKANYRILTASPKANGFYGAKGIAGFIPTVYLQLIKLFIDRVANLTQNKRITVSEYERPTYTFHGKGLWLYFPEDALPSLTLVGSPNFGYRSVNRDLEAQVAVVTGNAQLRKHLHLEQQRLYSQSLAVSPHTFNHSERFIPLGVKLVVKFFRNFF